MTKLCRRSIRAILEKEGSAHQPHPGLFLARGLTELSEENKAGDIKQQHIRRLCTMEASDLYRDAFTRWKAATKDRSRFTSFEARVEGRLYVGTSRDTPLETGITVHHTYGMPMIPGSSVKGIGRSICRAQNGCITNEEVIEYLFGNKWGEKDDASVISGGIVYYDAWWVPDGKPFVSEIVTVHHQEYYTSMGEKEATDFDSPVPAPQIATCGRYYFVIEGPEAWAGLASRIIQQALSEKGIGGKRSSGYGYLQALMD